MPETESFWKLRFSDLLVIGLAIMTLWVTWTIGASEDKQNEQIKQLKIIATNDTTTISKLTALADSQTSIINRLANLNELTGRELDGIKRQVLQLEGLNETAQKTFLDGHSSLAIIQKDIQRNSIYDQKAFIISINRLSTDLLEHINEGLRYVNDSIHSFTSEINQKVVSWTDQLYSQLSNLMTSRYVQDHPYLVKDIESYINFANVARIILAQGKNRQLVISRALWRSSIALNYINNDDAEHNKQFEETINNAFNQMTEEVNKIK